MQIVEHSRGRVSGPGLYRMPAEVYHADPAPQPSLSSSLIPKLALPGSTPAHVWLEHPRLGKFEADEEEEDAKMSIGSVAHELLLGHGGGFEVCDVKTWASKEAKAMRDNAIASGLTPIKIADYERASGIADALREKIEQFEETRGLFADGSNEWSEVVGIFQCPMTGIWGRFMMDRWDVENGCIYDVKTSTALLSEDFVQRQIDAGLGARAWWYLHGLRTLVPDLAGRLGYRWIFAEQRKPHEVLIRAPDMPHLYIGERQAITAALRFKNCLADNRWPGFPRHVTTAQVRPWAARDWRARETFSPDLADVALELAKTLSPFNTEAAGLPDDDEEIHV